MKIDLNHEVHLDILEAMEFYEATAGLQIAADFYFEFRETANRIASRPKSHPLHVKDCRRANLYRFPHNVLFPVVDEDTVRIIAVRHNSRHPSFGTDRS